MMFGRSNPVRVCGTLRVLGALLGYPQADMRGDLPEMRRILADERVLSPARLAELDALIARLTAADLLETEAGYVELFDRGRATSLHLFEHVHGDSRERGPAMIDLARTYEQSGLYLRPGELPDYLPVILEFLSTREPSEVRAFLGEIAHLLNALFNALDRRGSAYAAVPGALLELAGESVTPVKIASEPSLDESWDEPPVFDGCSTRGQARPGDPQPIRFVRLEPQSGVRA